MSLANVGFSTPANGIWIRRRGDEINVIQLQEHSVESKFCVNLGIHYSFLPKTGGESYIEGELIEIPDCELKHRLVDDSRLNDRWWPIEISSVEEVVALLGTAGLKLFDLYRLDGAIAELDGKSIEAGRAGLLTTLTKVRACLLIARMHEYLGHRDKCAEAATIGVKLAGMAVGPKKALKEILKRCGQPR